MRLGRQDIVLPGLIILAASPLVSIGVFVLFPLAESLVDFTGPHFSDFLYLYSMLTGFFLAIAGLLLIAGALLRFDLYWTSLMSLFRKR